MVFFRTTMPATRPADYYLGYLEGSVFMDFNHCEDNRVYLIRISFDGYGCCKLGPQAKPLNQEDSCAFIEAIQDTISNQDILSKLVKKAIGLNKTYIWKKPLKECHLV